MTKFKKEIDQQAVEEFCKAYRQGVSISQENGECVARRPFFSFDAVVTTIGGVVSTPEIHVLDRHPMKAKDWEGLLKLLVEEGKDLPEGVRDTEERWLKEKLL